MQVDPRRETLEVLGLKLLQPRFDFPGAKYVEPEKPKPQIQILATPTTVSESDTPSPAKASDAVSIGELLTSKPSELSVIAADKKDLPNVPVETQAASIAPEDKENTPQVEVIKFRHRVITVGKLLMVIDQPTLQWQQEKQCQQFFTDIHFSLTRQLPQIFNHIQFDWPPAKQFAFANTLDIAQQTFQEFVKEQQKQSDSQWVIIWGKSIMDYLPGMSEQSNEWCYLDETPVLIVDNVHQYWKEPAKKQVLAQQFKTIARTLRERSEH